jgi:hypothetical protein
LAANGTSVREIAEEVFGDRRFRGRVERILQTPALREESEAFVPLDEASLSAETVPTVRIALARYLARVARGEVNPSIAEMVKLLDLERRLQTVEALEQLKALD